MGAQERLTGAVPVLAGWRRGEPGADGAAEMLHAYAMASSLLYGFAPRAARPWLVRLGGEPGARPEAWAAVRVEILWSLHDSERGDAAGALEHCGRARRLLVPGLPAPPLPPGAAREFPWLVEIDAYVLSALPAVTAISHAWRGEFASAQAALSVSPPVAGVMPGIAMDAATATVFYQQGRLTDAAAAARRTLAGAADPHSSPPASLYGAYRVLAGVGRERGAFAEAEDAMEGERAVAAQHPGEREWAATTQLDLYELRRAAGEHAEADRILDATRRMDGSEHLPRYLRGRLIALDVRRSLDADDLASALRLMRSAGEHRFPLLRARLDLASGRAERAETRLRSAVPPEHGRRQAIERLVLLARAELRSGNGRRAVGSLARAVELARPDGYLQAFTDEGEDIAVLLERLRFPYPDSYVEDLLRRISWPAANRRPGMAAGLSEPLTDREREVLARLTSHLTQQEIAADLYVSVNTLKTHLKGLYRKLGAASRSEAIEAAAANHLLVPALEPPGEASWTALAAEASSA